MAPSRLLSLVLLCLAPACSAQFDIKQWFIEMDHSNNFSRRLNKHQCVDYDGSRCLKEFSFTGLDAPEGEKQSQPQFAEDIAIAGKDTGSTPYHILILEGEDWRKKSPYDGDTFGVIKTRTGKVLSDVRAGGKLFEGQSNMPDFFSLMYTGIPGKVHGIAHLENIPASTQLLEMDQDLDTGKLTVTKSTTMDWKSYGGLHAPCAGSLSPWNTHMGSEEWGPPDARAMEACAECECASSYARYMLGYFDEAVECTDFAAWKAKYDEHYSPYMYNFAWESGIDGVGKKHMAMGRRGTELPYVMPDEKTVYLTDDSYGAVLSVFKADTERDMSSGTLHCAVMEQVGDDSVVDGGSFTVTEWKDMGHATTKDIQDVVLGSPKPVFSVGLQENALAYLRHHRVSNPLQMKVYKTLKETGVKRWVHNYQKLSLAAFPPPLRRTIQYELWCSRLDSIDLIKRPACWNAELLYELAMAVHEEVFAPQVNVFVEGEMSTIAFMVIQGILIVSFDASDKNVRQSTLSHLSRGGDQAKLLAIPDYTAGMWVGEKALINPELRHVQTIFCKVTSHLMGVSADSFHALLETYELKEQFEELLRQHLWNGMCGRCGALGDHFSHDCRKTLGDVAKRRASSQTAEHRQHEEIMTMINEPKQSNFGLESFLTRHGLEYVLPALEAHGITSINDLNPEVIEDLRVSGALELSDEEWGIFTGSKVKEYRKMVLQATTRVLTGVRDDTHYIFISHYKFESGTEAALMKEDLVRLILEDVDCPGHNIKSAVFLDTEELRDLNDLKEHVRKSHNLLLLLTPDVLTRPWCLIEIVCAIQAGVHVVPVEVQRRGISFEYPSEEYYSKLVAGNELDSGAVALINQEDISMEEVADALRKVFQRIALPFSPHKTANVRGAELKDILKNCQHAGDRASTSRGRTASRSSYGQSERSQGAHSARSKSSPSNSDSDT